MKLEFDDPFIAPLPDGTLMDIVTGEDLKEYGAHFGVHRLRLGNHWSRDGH